MWGVSRERETRGVDARAGEGADGLWGPATRVLPGHVLAAHLARSPRCFHGPCLVGTQARGAAPREPWVLPLLPRSSAPRSPEPTPSPPRLSPSHARTVPGRETSRVDTRPATRHAVPDEGHRVSTRDASRGPGRGTSRVDPRRITRSRTRDIACRPATRHAVPDEGHRVSTRDASRGPGRGASGSSRRERGADDLDSGSVRRWTAVDTGSSGRGPGLARSRPSSLRARGPGLVKVSGQSREMGGEHVPWEGPRVAGTRCPPPSTSSRSPAQILPPRVARTSPLPARAHGPPEPTARTSPRLAWPAQASERAASATSRDSSAAAPWPTTPRASSRPPGAGHAATC